VLIQGVMNIYVLTVDGVRRALPLSAVHWPKLCVIQKRMNFQKELIYIIKILNLFSLMLTLCIGECNYIFLLKYFRILI